LPRVYFANEPSAETLRELYITQGLTSRAIAAEVGASKASILRWLKKHDIPVRSADRGLRNRGIEPPSKADLVRLVHAEHRSYDEIARHFGVDRSAITHWLKKHGIPRPAVWDTRYKGKRPPPLDAETLKALYESGLSTEQSGRDYGRSQGTVLALCDEHGIERRPDGWNGSRIECRDGHVVRSTYEVRVCDWLSAHAVPHSYEPTIPSSTFHADFLANGWYIEVWGVTDDLAYKERRERKEQHYRALGLPLIGIEVWHFKKPRKTLENKLRACLDPVLTPLGF